MAKDGRYANIANFGGQAIRTGSGYKITSNVQDASDFAYCISGADQSLFPEMDVVNNKDNCRNLVAEYASKNGWDDKVEAYYNTHTNMQDRMLFKSDVARRQSRHIPNVGMQLYNVNSVKPNSVIVSQPEGIVEVPIGCDEIEKVDIARMKYFSQR